MPTPLADKIRPTSLDEVVGQRHILGEGKPLRRIIESGKIPNMVFYGPSGTGKTTVAGIIAGKTNMRLHRLNGTSATIEDIRKVISEVSTLAGANGILLFLDEIQYLNKKQQQSLLEYIEKGDITLIASTTDNPYFCIYNAVLSRSTVFEFKTVSPQDIEPALERAFDLAGEELGCTVRADKDAVSRICFACGGDVRKAVNTAEICALSAREENGERRITKELADELAQRSSMRYDRDGDEHYDILSALQKSIRGSDENAALHYLARLVEAGDILSACRRLLVIACEDVGLAYPAAIPIVKACVDSAVQLGLPEARIPLADAVVLLATAPKSNSAYLAVNKAISDIKSGKTGEIPRHLQNKHYDGEGAAVKGQHYLYPHDYPHHYVKQQYLPDELRDAVYYEFGDNKFEQNAKEYREKIKKRS